MFHGYIYRLKLLNYSVKEIRELNVKIAHEQLLFRKKDEYDYRVEQLQAQGIDVFHRTKGIEHYKQFYKDLKSKEMKIKTGKQPEVKIDTKNNFLEG